MGVLGWTPRTVMVEAELEDLADALSGYMMRSKPQKQIPSEDFLKNMVQNFPDR